MLVGETSSKTRFGRELIWKAMQYFRRGSSLILLLANKRSFKVLFLGSGIHLMEDPNLKETRWIDLTAYPKFLMKIERVWIIMLIA